VNATRTPGNLYRSLGMTVAAFYLGCALMALLVATPYLNGEDEVLVRIAVVLGLVGVIPLVWYLAWTLTSLVAEGRIDRDPERPARDA
jgi:hypothetical protein